MEKKGLVLTWIGSGGRFPWRLSLSFCQPADVFSCRRGVPPGGRSCTAPLLSLHCGCVLLPLPWRWVQGFCDYSVGQAALTENSLTTTGRARFIPHRLSPVACPRLPALVGRRGTAGAPRGRVRGGQPGHPGNGWLSGAPGAAACRHTGETTRGGWTAGCLRWFLRQPEERQLQQTSEFLTTAWSLHSCSRRLSWNEGCLAE